MKAFTGLLAMLLLGAILAEDIPEAQSQPNEDGGCANFAAELYHRVQESLPEGENFAISPLGVSSLLGTLLFAVDQASGIEIANFLYPKCENSSEDTSSPSTVDRQGSQLTMATVALVRRGVVVDKQFEDQAAQLGSYVYKTSFWSYQRDFNEFVFNKTNDRSFFAMDGLLMDAPTTATRLALYNRVRYRASFQQKFTFVDRELFAPRVQALHDNIPELKASVLGLPLLNTSSYLLILVPEDGVDLKIVERELRKVDVRHLPSKLKPTTMDITLEKLFEHKYIYLRDALKKAGIRSVFNGTSGGLKAFNKEVPLDNALVVSGIELLEYGIDTDTENVDTHNVILKDEDSEEYPEFQGVSPLIYAVVDSERVYVMGRRLGKNLNS
ncbi:hypothetical protein KR038_007246 [Drosophila bunnanda]|nr:hypothetical protein KR038_007246 [Drosophila bunnanda]